MGNNPVKECLETVQKNTEPSEAQLIAVWTKYDENKDGNLDAKEMHKLMQDVFKMNKPLVEEDIKKQAKAMGPLGGMMLMMLPVILEQYDALLKQLMENPEMIEEMRKQFDVNSDGKVTRDEFIARAPDVLFKKQTNVAMNVNGSPGAPAECQQQ